MSLSDEGQALLDELEGLLASLEGRTELSQRLSRGLGIERVIIVGGDSDEEEWVKEALGYQAAMFLRSTLRADDVVAVTGGTTLAAMAKRMPRQGGVPPVKVVPARGGLGETVAVQANTIAAELAQQLGGRSIMLHVPDRLSPETLELLMQEPHIAERLQEIREATVVVHGIGEALRMARRRQLPEDEIELLQQHGAVAEAFGYYFNDAGDIVHAMTTAGLRLADLANARMVMGVAGGSTKARAIRAAARAYRIDVLVTDEGAARPLLELIEDSAGAPASSPSDT
jgi:central glycolytic genes regulator